ncbi:MAG: aspartyl/asparaginyl beta-hydroxylase domain-containing protein [Bacteroidia bacterium]
MSAKQNKGPKEAAWYSYHGTPYTGGLPAFFKTNEFPWVAELEANFDDIKNELKNYILQNQEHFKPYFNTDLVSKKRSWEVSNFVFWGKTNEVSCQKVTQTIGLLKKIPGFLSAGISVLHPGSDIKPHAGDTNTVMRAHLGLVIPEGLPACGLKVTDKMSGWEEGKVLMFCDAHVHSAWNHSSQKRFVLIFDVVHPVFLHRRKGIASNGLSLLRLQALTLQFPFLNALPGFVRGGIRYLCKFYYLFRIS